MTNMPRAEPVQTIVNEVQIVPIKPTGGLVAFASCILNGQLYLGALGVHKRLDGKGYRITYPTKKVGDRQLNYYHPITKEAGTAIEQAVAAKCIEVFERSDEPDGGYSKTSTNGSQPTKA